MKKLGSQILKNFKGTYQEVEKSILNPAKLDNSKYDIFSVGQITEYLGNVIKKNEGMAVEIQKSVVASVKSELSHLIPVNIKHNGTVKKFYVAKTGVCIELAKAMEPVNKQEGYFEGKINEDDVLQFIDENDNVDDEMLINKFGEEVTDVLNSLQEDGKLDVDDEGYYFITDESEEGEGQEGEEGQKEEEEGEEEQKEESKEEQKEEEGEQQEEGEEGEQQEEEGQGEEGQEGNEGKEEEKPNNLVGGEEIKLEEEQNVGGEEETAGVEEGTGEEGGEEGQEGVVEEEGQEGMGEQGQEEGVGEEGNMEQGNQKGMGEEQEGMGEEEEGAKDPNLDNDPNQPQFKNEGGEDDSSSNMTPEELEAFAKKTATVTLLKFYKNSTDEKLKEIAAVELKSRGVTPEEGQAGADGQQPGANGELPDNKAALDALETFTKNYLGDYDKEDLVNYVVELANQSPAKRKELKELYKEYYSMNNQGNSLLKVDENEFKEFLTDHYFNNFTPGDLQSYAYLMISKNPKEYRKFKKMMDLQNEPIV